MYEQKARTTDYCRACYGCLMHLSGSADSLQPNRPVVSCSSVARKTSLTPPAELVSDQDYLAQGDYDYALGDCNKAITDLTQAIELNPKFAEAYNNRAYVHMVEKDYAAALPDLDRAIQLRPDYVNARMNRGDIYNYYYAIDYERAVADYDRVLEIDPNAPNYTPSAAIAYWRSITAGS